MHKEKNQFLKQNKQCEELCKKIISLDMLATIENPAKKTLKWCNIRCINLAYTAVRTRMTTPMEATSKF